MKKKLAQNTEITVLTHERGELNPALYGDHNAARMTVADALQRDSQGRNAFHTSRGTLTVHVALADPAGFEAAHGVVLKGSGVSIGADGRPYVSIMSDDEILDKCMEARAAGHDNWRGYQI